MRLLALFVLGAACNPFLSAAQKAITPSEQLDQIDALLQAQPAWILATTAVVLVIVIPVLEELIFRGFLYYVLRRACSPVAAGAAVAALFSAMHGWPAALWLLPLAAGLSVLRARYGLAECIALHVGFNFGGVVLPQVLACI